MQTQYIYEKKWTQTSEKEALDIIKKEMPETDENGTLAYILEQIKKGKIVTLSSCRFRATS